MNAQPTVRSKGSATIVMTGVLIGLMSLVTMIAVFCSIVLRSGQVQDQVDLAALTSLKSTNRCQRAQTILEQNQIRMTLCEETDDTLALEGRASVMWGEIVRYAKAGYRNCP
jgi:uncharacterized membrane protein